MIKQGRPLTGGSALPRQSGLPRVRSRRRVMRTRISPDHVRAIGIMLGLALLLSLVYFAVSRPEEVLIPVSESTEVEVAPLQVFVHVAGDVASPGVLALPVGARVIDAITAAGGVLPGADTTTINLARLVEDGEQIVVGRTAVAAGPTLLDINLATAEELDRLPGIGPVLAQRIVDWRSEKGRFRSIEQLKDVAGVGAATFASLRKLIVVR